LKGVARRQASKEEAGGAAGERNEGGGRLQEREDGEEESFGEPAARRPVGRPEPREEEQGEKGEGCVVVPGEIRGEDGLEGDGGGGKEEKDEEGGTGGVGVEARGEDMPEGGQEKETKKGRCPGSGDGIAAGEEERGGVGEGVGEADGRFDVEVGPESMEELVARDHGKEGIVEVGCGAEAALGGKGSDPENEEKNSPAGWDGHGWMRWRVRRGSGKGRGASQSGGVLFGDRRRARAPARWESGHANMSETPRRARMARASGASSAASSKARSASAIPAALR
jgi:hypothetical protein